MSDIISLSARVKGYTYKNSYEHCVSPGERILTFKGSPNETRDIPGPFLENLSFFPLKQNKNIS